MATAASRLFKAFASKISQWPYAKNKAWANSNCKGSGCFGLARATGKTRRARAWKTRDAQTSVPASEQALRR